MTVDIIDTVPALFLGPTSDCFTPYVGPREWSICHTTTKKQQHLKINWPITKWQVKDGCHGLLFDQTGNITVRMCPIVFFGFVDKVHMYCHNTSHDVRRAGGGCFCNSLLIITTE
jgi:hypothetical protein